MEFEAEVTKADFKRLNTIAWRRVADQQKYKKKLNIVNILYWIPLGISAAALYHFYKNCEACDFGHLNISVVLACIWIIAGILLQKWYAISFVEHAVSDKGTVLGNIKFVLDANGITEIGEGYTSNFAWSSIQTVNKEKDCLFIFTDMIKAIILPTRELSETQVSELSGILKQHSTLN